MANLNEVIVREGLPDAVYLVEENISFETIGAGIITENRYKLLTYEGLKLHLKSPQLGGIATLNKRTIYRYVFDNQNPITT